MHRFLCQEERQFLIVCRGKCQGFISSVKLPPRTDEHASQRLPSLVGYLIGFLLLSFCFFLLRTAVWGHFTGESLFYGKTKKGANGIKVAIISRTTKGCLQFLTPGFQKSSAKTTRSAECRVRPMLAAVMDRTATLAVDEYWNLSHSCCRSADGVVPSIRM